MQSSQIQRCPLLMQEFMSSLVMEIFLIFDAEVYFCPQSLCSVVVVAAAAAAAVQNGNLSDY